MNRLGAEVQIYNTLKERLKKEYDLNEDDQCLLDTVSGEVSLEETIMTIVRDIKRTEAFATGIKFIIADNKARLERFERKIDGLRKTVAWAMQEIGRKKIDSSDLTISQRDGDAGVVVYNEAIVPHDYCQAKYTPSKTAIRKAMGEGVYVPGAEWSNGPPVLTIRTR